MLVCGHDDSLLIKSVESDYQFCELCEARKMQQDAEKQEAFYRGELEIVKEKLKCFCPNHVASEHDPKICGRCGIHIDELR